MSIVSLDKTLLEKLEPAKLIQYMEPLVDEINGIRGRLIQKDAPNPGHNLTAEQERVLIFAEEVLMAWVNLHEKLKCEIRALVHKWRRDTRAHSSIHEIMAHANVEKIREHGDAALPVLLEFVGKDPDWGVMHFLFERARDEIEVPQDSRGRLEELQNLLLEWGKSKGFC